jgi:hypothetical protein
MNDFAAMAARLLEDGPPAMALLEAAAAPRYFPWRAGRTFASGWMDPLMAPCLHSNA